MKQSDLSKPITLPCGVTLKNRVAKSAMTEALADRCDNPTEKLCRLYKAWSAGGFSVLLTGNVMVDRRYLERPGNVVVEDENALDYLKNWAREAKSGGSSVWMQISHPGRQCPVLINRNPLSPSGKKLRILGFYGRPRAMSLDDIEEAIGRYARTASIAKTAGFDGVQIHAAHGYLISQFLSPLTNRRTDEWGGALENRARFLRRIQVEVRKEVGPHYPVSVKMNSADFQKGGFSVDECVQVARWLQEDGVDLIEISGGNYEKTAMFNGAVTEQRASTIAREAYFLEYAREIRAAVSVPIMVTGGFRSKNVMEKAIKEDGIDIIGLARPACVVPDSAQKLLNGNIERFEMDESSLAIGKGRFGLNTTIWIFNVINTVSRLEYYCWQLNIISRGEPPQSNFRANALAYFIWYIGRTALLAFRRKKP